ncbi:hypothetical protein SteCoe_11559 [Stentor coeruleus]|uniref:Cache domain-containing protein n=1 Tax=Stentor coeruleus TaxID=5963 RepID=A0A1R2CD10_9CILI|nr:hypothetical protein SteCoe_11559 [Stentor coeruleus]
MGLRDKFSSLTLELQLQISIILSSALLCTTIILITYYQLNWLRNEVIDESEKTVLKGVYADMEKLGEAETLRITEFLDVYMIYIENLKAIETKVLQLDGSSQILEAINGPIQDATLESGTVIYDYGTFMSKFTKLSSSGIDLENKQAIMDLIFPSLYNENIVSIYSGFEINEISHRYPGIKIEDRTYSPITREWYYKAQDNIGIPVMTEPHFDEFDGSWVLSVSISLLDGKGKLYGAVGVDILIDPLAKELSRYSILDTGFVLLISEAGNMLNIPEQWNYDEFYEMKIYNETIGITELQWDTIKNTSDKSIFIFNHTYDTKILENNNNITTYHAIKYTVRPYSDRDNATHYIIVCVNYTEITEQIDTVRESFHKTFVVIFYVVLAFALFVFIIIVVLLRITGKKIRKQFSQIEKIFMSIIDRGLLPDMTREVSFFKLKDNDKGIETLVSACEKKVKMLKEKEDCFSYFDWKDCRPNDCLIYSAWTDVIFPFNSYGEKKAMWKSVLLKLEKYDKKI